LLSHFLSFLLIKPGGHNNTKPHNVKRLLNFAFSSLLLPSFFFHIQSQKIIPEKRHTAEERCPVYGIAVNLPRRECDDREMRRRTFYLLSATQVFAFAKTGPRATAG